MSKIKVNNILALPNTNLLIWTPGQPAASPPTEPSPRVVVTVAGKVGIGTQDPQLSHLWLESDDATHTDLHIINSSTGDAKISWTCSTSDPAPNSSQFSLGVDNSDSDKLKLGTTSVATNTAIEVTTAGVITFPAGIGQPAWQALSAYGSGNGWDFAQYWTNYGSDWAVASYMKDSQGFVHLKGLVKSTSNSAASTIFTLPSGYRPVDGKDHIFSAFGKDDSASGVEQYVQARLDVLNTGVVRIGVYGNTTESDIADANDNVSLDGIIFYAGF